MASTIVTKNSSTASAVPVAGDLTKGELAVNVTDKKLYTKDNGGSVVKLVGSLGNQEASAVAITGGAIDGTPVGGTTAAAGAFTTLSASGNTTLSGGTANGVAYLNGSKVVTTGSALTFDGTKFQIAGNAADSVMLLQGGASNYGGTIKFYADIGGGGNYYRAFISGINASGNGSALTFSTTASGNSDPTERYRISYDGTSIWAVSGSEQMRLTSTGLGIGTSSPGSLTAGGNNLVVGGGSGNTGMSIYSGTTGVGAIYFADGTTGADAYRGWFEYKHNTNNFSIGTNGSERVVLDSSGNLGLGVTPSAWNSAYKAIQVGTSASVWGASNAAYLGLNNYQDAGGTNRYINSNFAVLFGSDGNGGFQWRTAPSGTAGNAITFTQAMTLDASGNLGVGTTSPARLLHISGGASATYFQMSNNASGNTNADGFQIAQDGSNVDLINREAGYISFNTSNTERARIDSSGNLLVGKTASSNLLVNGIEAMPSGYTSFSLAGTTSATDTLNVYSSGASAYRFYVDMAGTIHATSTTISAISDIRFKENVRDLDAGLAEVMALKPRLYDWKEGKGANIKNARGFIAQEFEQVFPDLIDEWKDTAPEGEEPYKSVRQDLIPVLVKAIQELKAEVDSLKAQLKGA